MTGIIDGGDGGEGSEDGSAVGDQLFFGTPDQEFCREGDFDPDARAAEISALDPASDTTFSIGGQTYIFENFEALGAGFSVRTCNPFIPDGRVNRFDLAAPVVSYCTTDGGLGLFEVGEGGQGSFSLGRSRARLDAALAQALATGQHQEVARDEHGTVVYALNDGVTIQVNSPDVNEPGKTYTHMHSIDACQPQ